MREKANVAEQDETALKRNENFSLEIHIFSQAKKCEPFEKTLRRNPAGGGEGRSYEKGEKVIFLLVRKK